MPKRERLQTGTSALGHDFGRIDVLTPRQQSAPAQSPSSAPSSATPGGTPLRYSTFSLTPKSPDPSLSESTLESKLASSLKSYAVLGIKPGAPADTRLYLLYALRRASTKDNWGTEMDLIVPVTRSTTSGIPDPVGRVTIRIDADGNASVELIDTGPTPAAPATTVSAASASILADLHANVKDSTDRKWEDAEIGEVAAALAMIPADDRHALDGADLLRVKTVPNGKARFRGGTLASDGRSTTPAALEVADDAFGTGEPRFYGGSKGTVPALAFVILHEVGHAVESEVSRKAQEARDAAVVGKKKTKTVLKLDAAYAKTFVDPSLVAAARTDAETKKTTAKTMLSTALAQLPLMRADLKKVTRPYIDFIEDTQTGIETFETSAKATGADLVSLELAVRKEIERRDAERQAVFDEMPLNSLRETYEKIAAAQDEWFVAAATAARMPGRTLRLQKFVEFVTAKKITPFTQYARDNWPHNPSEFFAEAYAMWLSDPEFLETNSKALFEYFATGQYRA